MAGVRAPANGTETGLVGDAPAAGTGKLYVQRSVDFELVPRHSRAHRAGAGLFCEHDPSDSVSSEQEIKLLVLRNRRGHVDLLTGINATLAPKKAASNIASRPRQPSADSHTALGWPARQSYSPEPEE